MFKINISKKISFFILFFLPFLVSCSTIGDKLLNPYSSEFECPLTDNGMCINLKKAYEKSINDEKQVKMQKLDKETEKINPQNIQKEYENALLNKMTKLLKDPETPLLMSPKVVRVLFLPYKGDDNTLLMPRYVYFFLDNPYWILGDYLYKNDVD